MKSTVSALQLRTDICSPKRLGQKLLQKGAKPIILNVFKKIAKKIYTATPKKVHVDLDQLKSLSPEIVLIDSSSSLLLNKILSRSSSLII